MKKSYLFPTYFQKIGWIIMLPLLAYLLIQIVFGVDLDFDFKMPAFITDNGILGFGEQDQSGTITFTMAKTSFQATLFSVLMIVGCCFIAFAKKKDEDEYISKIREQSLVWSMLMGYTIFILLTLLVYGMPYIYVIMYDIDIFLLLFLCKFNYELWKLKRTVCKCKDEARDCKCNDCDCI
jgi:amino acid transporter